MERREFITLGASATAFDPEISVVNSGVINDVQATVTYDRKHVIITAQPANSALIAMQSFTFQRGAVGTTTLGFVGSAGGVTSGSGVELWPEQRPAGAAGPGFVSRFLSKLPGC